MLQTNESPDHVELSPAAPPQESSRLGYRLHRLEVFNWGTFDSTAGNVHTVPVNGETTLLVGHNESGKSTLVDALLTLLVRPGITRNFNVAAGASKGERTERTYIRGAYERRSSDESRSEIKYLRDAQGYYSALLACFRNETNGSVFTVAMILYLTEDNSFERLYCFAHDDRSIAANCAGLRSMDKLARQMQERGFSKTTKSYNEYFEWFRKATGVQPQAMDMFNQTVAVKDIHKLNDFIRKHMLEAKPWGEKVDELLRHFQDLSDAHRDLLRVQKQYNTLLPIEDTGEDYRQLADRLQHVDRLLNAAEAFFSRKVVDVFSSACEQKREELAQVNRRMDDATAKITDAREQCRLLQNEIDQAGGERLRRIPDLIKQHEISETAKREACRRFHEALRKANISPAPADVPSFQKLRRRLPGHAAELQTALDSAETKRRALIHQHGDAIRNSAEEEAELKALQGRRENLTAWLGDLRRNLCAELRLKEADLRFVAELIAVKQSERAWEPSVEMLLRGFALTLLVPERHYALVSNYIERTRLRDAQGRGQRLVYHCIRESRAPSGALALHEQSLLRKLDYRTGQALLPWVSGELQLRFNYRCCDTIEEFQLTKEWALTRERHIKHAGGRHEKDDRDQFIDRRRFVLGWDNHEKRRSLEAGIQELRQQIAGLDAQIKRFDNEQNGLRSRLQGIQDALAVSDYAPIDFGAEKREIDALRVEKQALEQNNDVIRVLKVRLASHEQQVKSLEKGRDQLIRDAERLEGDIKKAEQLVANATRAITELRASGQLARAEECFAEIEANFAGDTLDWDNLFEKKEVFSKSRRQERENLQERIAPVQEQLHKAMSHYLRTFPDDKVELTSDAKYLGDFLAILDRIRAEDLPKHERRFKERLNEKVGEEVGLLRSAFESERAEIEDRVDLLNLSLRQLEYRPGTHMRLQTQQVRDREIVEFRQALYDCVSGAFDGTPEANEQRFLRIEKLIVRLRDEESWRRKVTDVRNWFDFAAVEIDELTGEERSYHEDSSGKSGGGKAKLAFTILVAAIAYQYDLQPGAASDSRFHFVVVDEMFSRVDDRNSKYALDLFAQFGLQLLIVAPLDAKARITEPYVRCYLHVVKDSNSNNSEVFHMTAREFNESMAKVTANAEASDPSSNGTGGRAIKPR
jgi:uncharacterized protein YPO0396